MATPSSTLSTSADYASKITPQATVVSAHFRVSGSLPLSAKFLNIIRIFKTLAGQKNSVAAGLGGFASGSSNRVPVIYAQASSTASGSNLLNYGWDLPGGATVDPGQDAGAPELSSHSMNRIGPGPAQYLTDGPEKAIGQPYEALREELERAVLTETVKARWALARSAPPGDESITMVLGGRGVCVSTAFNAGIRASTKRWNDPPSRHIRKWDRILELPSDLEARQRSADLRVGCLGYSKHASRPCVSIIL
ncbi:hypothetical protein B0H17DRAFT_1283050 [Mycena rosella]|uniref:Uncharacterized protein n=1 Tax=Mycena rosella TaxID=1033263 RepID=A0AAD7FM27_MYCRO|nr:hypothetical protein B0H17DRAFT_1283050 [Mycena rosella]